AFDSLPQRTESTSSQQATDKPLDDEALPPEEENAAVVETGSPLRGSLYVVISELNRRLEAIAETGIQNGLATHRDWFAKSQREVHGFGLTALARSLDSLARSSATPGTLLKTRYLSHLHSQAVSHLM